MQVLGLRPERLRPVVDERIIFCCPLQDSFFGFWGFFFFNDTATTEIYTLSLHDALPICYIDVTFKQHYMNVPFEVFFFESGYVTK